MSRSKKALNRDRMAYKRSYSGKDYYLGQASSNPTIFMRSLRGASYTSGGHKQYSRMSLRYVRPEGEALGIGIPNVFAVLATVSSLADSMPKNFKQPNRY